MKNSAMSGDISPQSDWVLSRLAQRDCGLTGDQPLQNRLMEEREATFLIPHQQTSRAHLMQRLFCAKRHTARLSGLPHGSSAARAPASSSSRLALRSLRFHRTCASCVAACRSCVTLRLSPACSTRLTSKCSHHRGSVGTGRRR